MESLLLLMLDAVKAGGLRVAVPALEVTFEVVLTLEGGPSSLCQHHFT